MHNNMELPETLASFLSFDSLLRAAETHPAAPEIIYRFRQRFEDRRRDDGYPRLNIQSGGGYASHYRDAANMRTDPERIVRKLIPGISERLPGHPATEEVFSDQPPADVSRGERVGVASIPFRQFLIGRNHHY